MRRLVSVLSRYNRDRKGSLRATRQRPGGMGSSPGSGLAHHRLARCREGGARAAGESLISRISAGGAGAARGALATRTGSAGSRGVLLGNCKKAQHRLASVAKLGVSNELLISTN